MNNEILDDEIIHPVLEKRVRFFGLKVFLSVLFMEFIKTLFQIYIIFPRSPELLEEIILYIVISIPFFFLTIALVNYHICKGNYDLNIKSGYFILFFGSILPLFFSILSKVSSISDIGSSPVPIPNYYFWIIFRLDIIEIFLVFLKLFLIKPIAHFLTKKA